MSEPDDQAPPPVERPVLNYSAPVGGKLVVVARFNDYMEAELARNALDAEGIRCIVGGTDLTAGLGGYGPMRGTQVSVHEHDADAARAVLDRIAQRKARRIAQLDAPKCPKCGAPGARRTRTRLYVGLVGTGIGLVLFIAGSLWGLLPLIFGLYALLSLGLSPFRCVACGHVFPASEDHADDDDEE
jgi:hypothetical protein